MAAKPPDRPSRSDRLRAARASLPRSFASHTDAELLAAMRRREPGAFRAFVERFHRILLAYARRAGFDDSECDELVAELLDDAALEFLTTSGRAPDNIRRYLIGALRHRYFKLRRAQERRDRRVREAALELPYAAGSIEPRSVAAQSQHGLRELQGGEDHDPSISPVLEELSILLDEGLSAEERQLLTWASENIPRRQMAEWLGVDPAVARQRLSRLRRRLIEVAMRYAGSLERDRQRELHRFLTRCGVLRDTGTDAAG